MKRLIICFLIFMAASCFAVSQKLIDGAKAYDTYLEDL
jgi:hypothetical protein